MWGIASKPVPSRKRTAKLFLWLLRSKLGCLSIADTWTSWYLNHHSCVKAWHDNCLKIQQQKQEIQTIHKCFPGTARSLPHSGCSTHHTSQSAQQPWETSFISLMLSDIISSAALGENDDASASFRNYWLYIINTVRSCEDNAVINERSPALVDLQWTRLLNLNLCSSALRKGKVYTHLSDQLLLEDRTDVRPLPELGLPSLRSHLNVSTIKRFSTVKRF